MWGGWAVVVGRVRVAVVLGHFFGLWVKVKRVWEHCLVNCAEVMSTSDLLVLGATGKCCFGLVIQGTEA